MRQHVLAFAATLDASAGDVQLNAVPEQVFSIDSSNNFLIPTPMQLFLAYAGSVGMTRARLRTGSLLSKGLPQIYPLNLTVLPPTPVSVMNLINNPIKLRAEESLRVEITNAASVISAALLWVTPDQVESNINVSELRWIRFTATVVPTLLGWSPPVTITFQDTLEGGNYDIYGLACQGSTTVCARLILQNSIYRPGCLGQALNTAVPSDLFNGKTGKWGSFNTYSPPQIEVLGSAAGSQAQQGWLLCGKAA